MQKARAIDAHWVVPGHCDLPNAARLRRRFEKPMRGARPPAHGANRLIQTPMAEFGRAGVAAIGDRGMGPGLAAPLPHP
jgi:hypothetical protein